MSYYHYKMGQQVALQYDGEFYGVLQGLMRLADSDNVDRLKQTFPDVWDELQARYNAPRGLLSGEELE